MNRVTITKAILILSVLILTDFFGLLGESILILGIPTTDIPIIIAAVYCIVTFKEIRNRITPIHKIIVAYLVVVTLTIVSMPFREEESILQAFQVGRHYYLLLLAFVVDDNIFYSGSKDFIKKLIYWGGLYYTSIAIINYFYPDFVSTYLPGLRGERDLTSGTLSRNYITDNNGVLFVHLSFLYKSFETLCSHEKKIIDISLSFFFLAGMLLVGLRAPLFGSVAAFGLIFVVMSSKFAETHTVGGISQIKYFALSLLAVLVFNELSGGVISNFTDTIINDVSAKTELKKNTFRGREKRAMAYQIPRVREQPMFGIGFIYKNTKAASKYGYKNTESRYYSLYNMDFGYGTMWVSFGIIGSIIIMFSIFLAIQYCLKLSKREITPELLQCAALLIAFSACNYTWAVLEFSRGLFALSLCLGLANEIALSIKESESI